MGGCAFLIYGTFDHARAAANARQPGFFDRLRGRKAPALSTTALPGGRTMLEFPADAIAGPLVRNYHGFLRERVAPPSPSSKVVLAYLALGQPTIFLRSDRTPSQPDARWYVQVSFSGAAGMAETSARVAAHWAWAWYSARASDIARILEPAGFTPAGAESWEGLAFVPTGEYGYAEREDGAFSIDAAFLDSAGDPAALLADLEQQYGGLLAPGRCLCQLCERTA